MDGNMKEMVRERIKFLPLLLFYVIVVIVASSNSFYGDESGYVGFANNLSHGYYSPHDDVDLWFGPGYPIVLLPFVLLRLPWLAAKLLNALFLLGAIIYFYQTLYLYVHERHAFVIAFLFGIYPPFLREIHLLLPESFVLLLVCGFLFHFCRLHQDRGNSWAQLLTGSVFLGYLALTKVFFGYVILAGTVLFLVLYLWKRETQSNRSFLICLFALVCCLPYLLYTYSLTGRILYWGNSGGMSLYWMSTPYQGEWGSWFSSENVYEDSRLEPHRAFFDSLSGLSGVERDDAFKRQAVYNITHHPTRFVANWMANIGRLLFSYPFSYTPQKLSTYFYILPNMFIVVLSILSLYPGYLGRRLIPYEIYASILLGLIALGGTSLLSAFDRQFRPLVPVFVLWISFILVRVLRIEIRQELERLPSSE
jgi:hypothetical protein